MIAQTSLKECIYLLAVSIGIIIGLVRMISDRKQATNGFFRNAEGKSLVLLPQNTRFTRFTHGSELSTEGMKMSSDAPYLVKNGSIRELVIFNPSQNRDFFAADGKYHEKKKDCNFGNYFDRMLGQCVGVQNGAVWQTSRRYMEPHFSLSAAAFRLSEFEKELQKWVSGLPEDPKVGERTEEGFCIDSEVACRELPFRLIAMALYGDMLTDNAYAQLWSLNNVHEKIVHSAFLESWPQNQFYKWLPTQANRILKQYEKDWQALNLSIITKANQTNTTCAMVDMYRGVEKGDMTLAMYLQSLDEILFTNIDVTATMFASSIINLGRHVKVQEELRQEILAQTNNIESYIRREDTLLHKTYLEVLRISPPAWFSLPEVTAVDKTIGGFLIPSGTSVITDVHRLNKLSPIWGADGNTFRPHRFDDLSGTQIRYSMHGYGVGPRKCLGKNFANLIIKLLMLSALKEYELRIEGEEKTTIRRDRFTCTPEQVVHFKRRAGIQLVYP